MGNSLAERLIEAQNQLAIAGENEKQQAGLALQGVLEEILTKLKTEGLGADLGMGCNGFHFIAFLKEPILNRMLPNWADLAENAIASHAAPLSLLDKINEASESRTPEGVPAFNNDTPLSMGLFTGNNPVSQWLIKRGASITHINGTGNSTLHLSSATGCCTQQILAKLQQNSAIDRHINLGTHTGNTPLHQAARGGKLEVAQALIAAGADKSSRNQANQTPADMAKAKGHDTLATLLSPGQASQLLALTKNPILDPGFLSKSN